MGYYFTFVFDPTQESFDRDKLIERFLREGANSEDDDHYDGGKAYFYKGHPVSFGGYKQEEFKKGYYADVRFSWASKPDELVIGLTELLDLADRLGCRIYDGQLDIWMTRENIISIVNGFKRQASHCMRLFGGIDKKSCLSSESEPLSLANHQETTDKLLSLTIDDLKMFIRPTSCLKNAGITYVGELVQYTPEELRKIPNMGRKSIDHICEVLADIGLSLGIKIEGWPPDRMIN